MALLEDQYRRRFLDEHPAWALDGEEISRTFVFADFVGAMGFVTRVAMLAERAGHHPDIDVRWNKVRLALTTHDQGGLTGQDIALAAEIEALTA